MEPGIRSNNRKVPDWLCMKNLIFLDLRETKIVTELSRSRDRALKYQWINLSLFNVIIERIKQNKHFSQTIFRNRDIYSIYFDIEHQIFQVDNDHSFLSEGNKKSRYMVPYWS